MTDDEAEARDDEIKELKRMYGLESPELKTLEQVEGNAVLIDPVGGKHVIYLKEFIHEFRIAMPTQFQMKTHSYEKTIYKMAVFRLSYVDQLGTGPVKAVYRFDRMEEG